MIDRTRIEAMVREALAREWGKSARDAQTTPVESSGAGHCSAGVAAWPLQARSKMALASESVANSP